MYARVRDWLNYVKLFYKLNGIGIMYKYIYYFCLNGINNPPFAYNMVYKNNPLNIRYSNRNHWLGQLPSRNGFCRFTSLEYGVRAALINLRTYRNRGIVSIRDIITTWAPISENNTYAYISFIIGEFVKIKDNVVTFDTVMSSALDYCRLVSAMAMIESRSFISSDYVFKINNRYHIFKV